jgi:hypothetical protein
LKTFICDKKIYSLSYILKLKQISQKEKKQKKQKIQKKKKKKINKKKKN